MLFDTTLFTWSAAQFQALNPIWIMLLARCSWVYNAVAKSGRPAGRREVRARLRLGGRRLVFTISEAVDGRVSSWFMVWATASTRSANCW